MAKLLTKECVRKLPYIAVIMTFVLAYFIVYITMIFYPRQLKITTLFEIVLILLAVITTIVVVSAYYINRKIHTISYNKLIYRLEAVICGIFIILIILSVLFFAQFYKEMHSKLPICSTYSNNSDKDTNFVLTLKEGDKILEDIPVDLIKTKEGRTIINIFLNLVTDEEKCNLIFLKEDIN